MTEKWLEECGQTVEGEAVVRPLSEQLWSFTWPRLGIYKFTKIVFSLFLYNFCLVYGEFVKQFTFILDFVYLWTAKL